MSLGKAITILVMLAGVCGGDPLPDSGPCVCKTAKNDGGWCPECKAGYLAGVRVPSRLFFETIDAHGHEIDLSALRCQTCKKAAADGGYCETCRIGFHQKKVFFTRLTFELARGAYVERENLKCEKCRLCAEPTRWCEPCGMGRIGNLVISSKDRFETAKAEFTRFLAALELLPQCEDCAVAYFMRSLCPKCRKDFQSDPTGDKKPP